MKNYPNYLTFLKFIKNSLNFVLIKSKTQNECKNAPLQYSYPYKKFITKFKKLFELKTVFNIIDPKEKE